MIQLFLKYIKNIFLVILLLFIAISIYLAIKAYNNTWTIENNHFKSIYDDYDDCMKNNSGTGTTDICKNKNKVKYKNDNYKN